jgi:single-stranded-DNA-specific exonuclease
MQQNKTRWVSRKLEQPSGSITNLDELKFRLLAARGVEPDQAVAYLNPDLSQLSAPEIMKGLSKAIGRIQQAMADREPIVIYGDYDVDGMTSISILVRAFRQLKYPVDYYIPDRHEEGYGLNADAIQTLIENGTKVIITVDCGITSTLEAKICSAAGVDLIITDHHEPHEQLPEAFAILNPKQSDCQYPYKHLAGAGISLRVAESLLGEAYEDVQTPLLELAAFGTVADVAPLLGENRILVYHGLKTMSETTQTGLRALIEATNLTGKAITAGHIGFILGPKLNAAGRISDPTLGVKLLTTEDPEEAARISGLLVEMNEERQAIERDIVDAAIAQVESRRDVARPDHPLPSFIIVSGEGWHSGVIGIVASRIVERYHRPVIVFGIQNGTAKGSGRSIPGFNIFEALQTVAELFEKFGGHEQAAGMSLKQEKLPELEQRLNTYADGLLTEEDFKPLYSVEATLSREAIRFELTDLLKKLEPYGIGNPKPLFRVNDLIVERVSTIGKVKSYLKVLASDGLRTFDLVNFQNSEIFEPLKSRMRFDALVNIEENEFRGARSIQFHTRDVRILEPSLHFDAQDIEYFQHLKAEAMIRMAYHETRSGADGKIMPAVLDKETVPKEPGNHYVAYSLQGWLAFHHRCQDHQPNSGNFSELHLCPQTPQPFAICLDPPETDLKAEAARQLPNRDHLKAVYLAIRNNKPFPKPLPLKTTLSLHILAAAGLIEFSGDQYRLKPVAGKVDLTTTPALAALNRWVHS